MVIYSTAYNLNVALSAYRAEKKSLGFVPTMGALHQGHISLLEKAKTETDIVVCSIYVNPLQFNNTEDFEKYPRLAEQDCIMLQKAGCDIVYIPDNSIISDSTQFIYNIGYLDSIMEGFYRPNHFKGVAYIVKKLFENVKPDRAYFGEKDYQQLMVIKKMNSDFNFPIEIISCATIREHDGLAMSSRNARLSTEDRALAPKIYEALTIVKNNISKHSFMELKSIFTNHVEQNTPMKIEYVEICDADTLKVLSHLSESKNIVVCTAVFLRNVRLIDNIKINL